MPEIGDLSLDLNNNDMLVCVDNTVASPLWTSISAAGGADISPKRVLPLKKQDLPEIGSVWKVRDPDLIPAGVPKHFWVANIHWETYYTALDETDQVPMIQTSITAFSYYFTLEDLQHYEEVTDESEIGLLLLADLP